MKKITYIISDIDKALAFEWIALGLRKKFDLNFILIGKAKTRFSFFLEKHSIRYTEIDAEKYPSRVQKWLQVFFILWREKPDTVHTHLWNANLLGLSTAWLLGIKQRIYTRHHAVTHYREFPSGRKWDVLCNSLATHIVAISKNVKEILVEWDKANQQKIRIIHHGFDFSYFESITSEQVELLKNKYIKSEKNFPVIGVISRYVQWKGVQYIIPAFQKIRKQYPTAKLILANAYGEYEPTVKKMLRSLPPNSFVEIRFEEDLAALYRLFDVFVHVPVDRYSEAFGQTYIESLMTQTPSIFTLSGIAQEFIVHKRNAWVVDFENSDQIVEGVIKILQDDELRKTLKQQGIDSVQQFSLDPYILALENLYTG